MRPYSLPISSAEACAAKKTPTIIGTVTNSMLLITTKSTLSGAHFNLSQLVFVSPAFWLHQKLEEIWNKWTYIFLVWSSSRDSYSSYSCLLSEIKGEFSKNSNYGDGLSSASFNFVPSSFFKNKAKLMSLHPFAFWTHASLFSSSFTTMNSLRNKVVANQAYFHS